MKKLLTIIFLLPLVISAQDYNYENLYLPKNDGKIKYVEVVSANGFKKEELYKNARIWFLDNFKSAKAVINFEDEQTGIISGRGNTDLITYALGHTVTRTLFFSVRIEVKDEKFRYEIDQIEISYSLIDRTPIEVEFSMNYMYNRKGKPNKNSWEWYSLYEKEIHLLENSLKSEIPKKKEDW